MAGKKASANKIGMIASIMALFNLKDEGKLVSFFQKVRKDLEREIAAHKHNWTSTEFTQRQKISDLEDELADAKEALENAYLEVPKEQIASKQAQTDYVEPYLENISAHQANVQKLSDKLKEAKSGLKDSKEKADFEIKRLEDTLATISSGVDVSEVIENSESK